MSPELVMVLAVLLLAVAALLAAGWYLSYTAVRLDRLHTRLDATAAALDTHVVRRAQYAVEMAYGAGVDPASAALLLDAARICLDYDRGWSRDRCRAETAMTEVMAAVAPAAAADPEIAQIAARVKLARRFHNDAVDQTLLLRARPVVRVLRLAGHTDFPEPVEFVDTWPSEAAAGAA